MKGSRNIWSCLIFLILIPFIGYGQAHHFVFPQVKEKAKSLSEVIPTGWELKDSVNGYFNADQLTDVAMVLKSEKPLNDSHTFYPKMLVILLKNGSSEWRLSAVATRLFDTTATGPFIPNAYQGLTVRSGTLGVQYAYGGTLVDNLTYYFRLQNEGWYLIGLDDEQMDKQKTFGVYLMKAKSVNFITGKETVKKYNQEEKKYKSRISNRSPKPLVGLTEFGDNGLPYQTGEKVLKTAKKEEYFGTKAKVDPKDSIIRLSSLSFGPGYTDWRMTGYAKPDTNSQKMIIISVYTNEVKGNPFHCPYGAYYGTNELKEDSNMQLKYFSTEGSFIKAGIMKEDKKLATIYIQKKRVDVETGYVNPTGTYKWKHADKGSGPNGYPGYIQVNSLDRHTILLNLYVAKGAPSYNSGTAYDTLTYRHNQAVYRTKYESSCAITFRFTEKGVHVNEKTNDYNSGCGFGHAVVAGGYFEKINSKVPEFINYSTGRKFNLRQ